MPRSLNFGPAGPGRTSPYERNLFYKNNRCMVGSCVLLLATSLPRGFGFIDDLSREYPHFHIYYLKNIYVYFRNQKMSYWLKRRQFNVKNIYFKFHPNRIMKSSTIPKLPFLLIHSLLPQASCKISKSPAPISFWIYQLLFNLPSPPSRLYIISSISSPINQSIHPSIHQFSQSSLSILRSRICNHACNFRGAVARPEPR